MQTLTEIMARVAFDERDGPAQLQAWVIQAMQSPVPPLEDKPKSWAEQHAEFEAECIRLGITPA